MSQIGDNLVGDPPGNWLLQGPTKRYVDAYHWHKPDVGIVASYTPTAFDVNDHFDVFRGVDQVEAFAQATIVSCGAFSQCKMPLLATRGGREVFLHRRAVLSAPSCIGMRSHWPAS